MRRKLSLDGGGVKDPLRPLKAGRSSSVSLDNSAIGAPDPAASPASSQQSSSPAQSARSDAPGAAGDDPRAIAAAGTDSSPVVVIDPRRRLPSAVQHADGRSVYRRGAMVSEVRRDGATKIQFEREDGMPLDVITLPQQLASGLPSAYTSYAEHLASQDLRMTVEELQAFHLLYLGHVVHARKLVGGFKSSVWACTTSDKYGHACVPTIAKFAPADELRIEYDRHVMLQYVVPEAVPRILKFVQRGTASAMCMTNEKSGQSFETVFLSAQSIAHVNLVLDQLFGRTLHRLYREAVPIRMNLFEYYFMKPGGEQTLRLGPKFQAKNIAAKLPMMLGIDDELTPKVRNMIEAGSVPLDVGVVGESAEYLKNFLMFGPVCYAKTRAKIQIKAKMQPVHVVPIVTEAFERAVDDPAVRRSTNTTASFLHGDLNARNILIKERDRICLIDFDHVHKGHSLRDFAKLENDLMYVLTPIETDLDLGEALEITMALASIDDLTLPLPHTLPGLTRQPLQRTWLTIVRLREWVAQMHMTDDSARDYKMALLSYATKSLAFRDNTAYQRRWALASASLLAHIVFSGADGPTSTLVASASKASAGGGDAGGDSKGDGDHGEAGADWEESDQHDIKLLFFYLQHEGIGYVRKQDLATAVSLLLDDEANSGAIKSAKIEGDTADRWVKRKHNSSFDFTMFKSFLDVEHLDRAGIVTPLIAIAQTMYQQSRVAEDTMARWRGGERRRRLGLGRRWRMLAQHAGLGFVVLLLTLRSLRRRVRRTVKRLGLGALLRKRRRARVDAVEEEPSFRWFVEGEAAAKASNASLQQKNKEANHRAQASALQREHSVARYRREAYFVAMLVPWVCILVSQTVSFLAAETRASVGDACAEERAAPVLVYIVIAVMVSAVNEKRTVFTLHNTQHLRGYELLLPVDTQKVSNAYQVAKQLVDRWRSLRGSDAFLDNHLRRFGWARSRTAVGSIVSSGALHVTPGWLVLTCLLPGTWVAIWPLARHLLDDSLGCETTTAVELPGLVAQYSLLVVSLLLLTAANAQVERVLDFFDNFTALTSLRASSLLRLPYVPLNRKVNVHGWMQLREFVMGYFTRGNPYRLAIPVLIAKTSLVAAGLTLVIAWRLLTKADPEDDDYLATHISAVHMLVGVTIVVIWAFPVLLNSTVIMDRVRLTTSELQQVEYDLQLRALHVSQIQHYSPDECAQMRECAHLARIAIRVAEQDHRLPRIFGLPVSIASVALVQMVLLVLFVLTLRLVDLELLVP